MQSPTWTIRALSQSTCHWIVRLKLFEKTQGIWWGVISRCRSAPGRVQPAYLDALKKAIRSLISPPANCGQSTFLALICVSIWGPWYQSTATMP